MVQFDYTANYALNQDQHEKLMELRGKAYDAVDALLNFAAKLQKEWEDDFKQRSEIWRTKEEAKQAQERIDVLNFLSASHRGSSIIGLSSE